MAVETKCVVLSWGKNSFGADVKDHQQKCLGLGHFHET